MEWTRVWVTSASRGSPNNYHDSPKCAGLREAGGLRQQYLKNLKGVGRCSLCWDGLSDWDLVTHDVERDGDTAQEVEFVRRVLSRVRGLEPQDVEPQGVAKLEDGTKLRIDFVLHRAGARPLAIELDGFDKTGRPEDAPKVAQADKAKRRQLEQQLNYEVVPFANKDLATPHGAIRDIEVRLEGAITSRSPAKEEPTVAPSTALAVKQIEPGPATPRRIPLAIAAIVLAVLAGWGLVSFLGGNGREEPSNVGSCAGTSPIKGNLTQAGEKIFHEPGWRYYESTRAEACFEDSDAAASAGYRPSQIQ